MTAIATAINFKDGYFVSNCYVLLVDLVVGTDHLRHLDGVSGLISTFFNLGINFDDIGILKFPHGGQHSIRGNVLVPDGVAIFERGVI